MKGVDSHGCCKNYCENRITASAYMPDNDTTGGYVLHMAVGNGISYPACAFWLGSGVAGNIQNQIDGVDHWRKE